MQDIFAGGSIFGDTYKLHTNTAVPVVGLPKPVDETSALRDTFAGLAMSELLFCAEVKDDIDSIGPMCKTAYKWADAMLIAREAKEAV